MEGEGLPDEGLDQCREVMPIISEVDRNLLSHIRTYIETETDQLGSTAQVIDGQRYIIYKNAFDKVIENTTAYKNILTAIKREYDESIDVLLKGQKDSLFLQRKLKSMASEPATFVAYKNRVTQLQKKIEIINKNTSGLEARLQIAKESSYPKDRLTEELLLPQEETSHFKHISGLTFEESVNVADLCKHLRKLESRLKDAKVNKETKYVSVQIKTKITQEISQKMQQWEELVTTNEQLKLRYSKLKIIADAVATWGYSDKSISLTEFILPSLTKAKSLKEVDQLWPGVFDDDNPGNIDEAAYLLEYVESFTKLFDDKQYKAAAIYVANCPRGILHNMEIMEKFKAVTEYEGYVSPLLDFFEAVMNSYSAVRHPPIAKMSLEGVKCALTHNRLDLVTRWVMQQRLTCSEALGDALYDYGETELQDFETCMALAQTVYNKCGVHKKAVLCMCMVGELTGAMEYIHDSKRFSLDDYLFLLNNYQNTELLRSLTREWKGNPAVFSIGQAVLWLVSTDPKDAGFHLLQEIYDQGQGALEQAILNDGVSTLEDWQEIADACNANSFNKLAKGIFRVLTSQEGGTVITFTSDDDKDGAKLTEHVLL
ncbi:clathrin heavy chain linker domain-containing protein 1-like isoform X1 [Leucoraja erinacea]|uniref:clathrin heavy chain linker domain-containing protein 1-like isoform X1 n=1 Tax=Leucoraja erinaceus TaxID=7782 RepID=UPI00245667F4|nr:clathrin heavy chain linker domain-containing protein 1-like isoform X1 [Leucoraja erinacea]